MVNGSLKTFTAIYRLHKFSRTNLVPFLVDTRNPGWQGQESMAFYHVQRLSSSHVPHPTCRRIRKSLSPPPNTCSLCFNVRNSVPRTSSKIPPKPVRTVWNRSLPLTAKGSVSSTSTSSSLMNTTAPFTILSGRSSPNYMKTWWHETFDGLIHWLVLLRISRTLLDQ
jgi:hypothetical protein